MPLAVRPPLAPMLAKLSRELPRSGFRYEPKWDGFRALVFRDGDDVDVRSRNDKKLARYFPEVVDAVRSLPCRDVALDGEDLRSRPLSERRARLEALLRDHPTDLFATPQTEDANVASPSSRGSRRSSRVSKDILGSAASVSRRAR